MLHAECGAPGFARASNILLVVAASHILAPAVHGQEASTKPVTLTWQSRNTTVKELSGEFAQLYSSLADLKANGKVVPTRKVVVPAGKSIEDTLRDQGVFAGRDMPLQVDTYVCGLNPGVCKVKTGPSKDKTASDARTVWKIQPNAEIVVPDIKLEPITVHRPYNKLATDTLAGIVRDRESCPTFNDACVAYLKNLNKRAPKEIDEGYEGMLNVPTRAYRATIVLDPNPFPATPMIGMQPPPFIPDADFKNQVLPKSKARVSANDGLGILAEGTRARVLSLIGYPTGGAAGFSLPSNGISHLTVMDTKVDAAHCMLRNVKVLDETNAPATTRPQDCGGRQPAIKARDHGTHVVGLIAAITNNDAGPGVNPRAAVTVMTIDFDKFKEPKYVAMQGDRLNNLYSTDSAPDVVNISFEYTVDNSGGNDVFWDAIAAQENNTLFVVSAGNDSQPLAFGNTCNVKPACQRAPNVITVGALGLEDNPGMTTYDGKSSNFGPAVHVGAPGVNIVSTIAQNKIGVLSGTSQAAPLVSGVASLMYLKDKKLQPVQVKNRIIYTSDLFPSLYERMLGGRINATRALAYSHARVKQLTKAEEVLSLKSPLEPVVFGDFENQDQVLKLRFGQVRRLHYEPTLKYYALYYTDSDRDSGELKRKFVTLKNPAAVLKFGKANANGPELLVQVRLDRIDDYTAALVR